MSLLSPNRICWICKSSAVVYMTSSYLLLTKWLTVLHILSCHISGFVSKFNSQSQLYPRHGPCRCSSAPSCWCLHYFRFPSVHWFSLLQEDRLYNTIETNALVGSVYLLRAVRLVSCQTSRPYHRSLKIKVFGVVLVLTNATISSSTSRGKRNILCILP